MRQLWKASRHWLAKTQRCPPLSREHQLDQTSKHCLTTRRQRLQRWDTTSKAQLTKRRKKTREINLIFGNVEQRKLHAGQPVVDCTGQPRLGRTTPQTNRAHQRSLHSPLQPLVDCTGQPRLGRTTVGPQTNRAHQRAVQWLHDCSCPQQPRLGRPQTNRTHQRGLHSPHHGRTSSAITDLAEPLHSQQPLLGRPQTNRTQQRRLHSPHHGRTSSAMADF